VLLGPIISRFSACSNEEKTKGACSSPISLPVSGSMWVGSSLACKYRSMVEVTNTDKHSSLLQYQIYCNTKKFFVQAPGVGQKDDVSYIRYM